MTNNDNEIKCEKITAAWVKSCSCCGATAACGAVPQGTAPHLIKTQSDMKFWIFFILRKGNSDNLQKTKTMLFALNTGDWER